MKRRVVVLFGGHSAEHEVSVRSATSVINALASDACDVVPVAITKEGHWLSPAESVKRLPDVTRKLLGLDIPAVSGEKAGALIEIGRSVCDERTVVIPVLHGPYGEDGTVQGLLELADVPYIGSGVAGSAVGMDKNLLKRLLREADLSVVDFMTVLRSRWRADRDGVVAAVEERLSYPIFVKPACLGSSVGISKAHDRGELLAAMDLASEYDPKLILEQGIDAREFEVSVLGNDEPEASCVGEIIPGGEFYDYEEKYLRDTTTLVIPAEIDDVLSDDIRRLAIEAFRAADCSGLARADFLMERASRKVYLSELNTMPGFTAISMYPKLWEHSGLPYAELLDRLIDLAIERYEDRRDVRVER